MLVLVIAAWSQVEFWTKALTPWQEMRQRPCRAEISLLLDYISTNQLVAIWNALKNKHWAVLSASCGTLLLRLITIFSTGLLVLQPSEMTNQQVPMTSVTRFNAHQPRNVSTDYFSGEPDYSAAPGVTYAGVLRYGLPYPEGTTATAAYSSIAVPANLPRNAVIKADTVGFYPKLDCEVAKLDGNVSNTVSEESDWSTSSPFYFGPTITLTTNNCSLVKRAKTCDPVFNSCPEREIATIWDTSDTYANYQEHCAKNANETNLVFVVVDVRYKHTDGKPDHPDPAGNTTSAATIAKMAGIICRPSYSAKNSTLTMYPGGAHGNGNVTLAEHAGAGGTQLSEFSPMNLTNAIIQSFNLGPAMFGDSSQDNFVYSTISDKGAMYKLMQLANRGSGTEAFLDPEVLIRSSDTVFRGIASQVAQTYLRAPANETVIGEVDYFENRLHVKALTVWLMGSGLVLMMLMTMVVLLFRPTNVVPRDPTSIAASGAILASSQSLGSCLRGTGFAKISSIQTLLSTSSYYTTVDKTEEKGCKFEIEVKRPLVSSQEISSSSLTTDSARWWRPMALRRLFLIAVSLLLIALIIILEILQMISDHDHGIVGINLDSDIRFAASIVPAAVTSLITITFSSIDLNIRIFIPYKSLYRRSASARQSILRHYNGKGTISSTFDAIKYRHAPVLFSTLTITLASLLTIFVSGLYVRQDVSTSEQLDVGRTDQFNLTWNTNIVQNYDKNAGMMLSLVHDFNLSYPKFTYDELAFPTLELPKNNDSVTKLLKNATDLSLRTNVPSLRASLDCSSVPKDGINITYDNLEREVSLNVSVQLPPDCKPGGVFANQSVAQVLPSYFLIPTPSEWEYRGAMQDFNIPPTPTRAYIFQESAAPGKIIPDSPDGCPTLIFYFGSIRWDATSTDIRKVGIIPAENTTVLVCHQLVEEIQTDTTFTLPDLAIDSARPPIPDESTAKVISDGTAASSKYRKYHLENSFKNEVVGTELQPNSAYTRLDNFFTLLVNGTRSEDPATLVGPDNEDRLINAVQHLYRLYMAQAISLNMRQDMGDTSISKSLVAATEDPNASTTPARESASSYTVTVTNLKRTRLKQDRTSKLLLQITMGVCLLLGALACLTLGDICHVLPHNPCSIAGVMSLLAGSEIVSGEGERKVIPRGAEWMSDKEWEKKKVWEGWVFGMGWWTRTGDDSVRREGNENAVLSRKEDGHSRDGEEGGSTTMANDSGPEILPALRRREFGIDVGRPERYQND